MVDQRFSRVHRLRLQTDFDRVYQQDAYLADHVLVVHGCRNGLAISRLGLSVSRKVGGAVVRNGWKRRIREAFRQHREHLPAGFDFVVRPRRGAVPDYPAIAASLPRLLSRLAGRLSQGAS